MAAPAVTPFISGECIEHRRIRSSLQVHVERGVNLQSALVYLVGAVLVFEISADFLNEVGAERIGIASQFQPERRIASLLGLLGCNLAVFKHAVDHEIAAV